MKKRAHRTVTLLVLTAAFLFPPLSADAQNAAVSFPVHSAPVPVEKGDTDRAVLATSSIDYPVTPGDVYQLSYTYSSAPVSLSAVVDSTCRVSFPRFGDFPAKGMTFSDLRKQVESKVVKEMQGGVSSLTVASAGVFQVYVQGEVQSAAWVEAWGLTRLHTVLENRLTRYSSIREVEIVSDTGVRQTYDLFRASRLGSRDQDPLVRPGDTIAVHRRGREIAISGEVERPGSYQLQDGEELGQLLQFYAGGLTGMADAARIEIVRWEPNAEEPARMLRVDGGQADVPLQDLDSVRVPSVAELRPVVFFEGSVLPQDAPAGVPANVATIRYPFAEGETLGSAAQAVRSRFTGDSDIEHAVLIRSDGAQKMPVNLTALMSDSGQDDPALMPFDRIVIPRREFLVTVGGAVLKPGRYPYSPQKSWRYYVDLAGGFDGSRHAGDSVTLLDANDRVLPADRHIEPDDRIIAPANFPSYLLTPVAEVVTAAAAVATVIVTIISTHR